MLGIDRAGLVVAEAARARLRKEVRRVLTQLWKTESLANVRESTAGRGGVRTPGRRSCGADLTRSFLTAHACTRIMYSLVHAMALDYNKKRKIKPEGTRKNFTAHSTQNAESPAQAQRSWGDGFDASRRSTSPDSQQNDKLGVILE
ncbi:unnamed protein product, partial [Brenthis ino]